MMEKLYFLNGLFKHVTLGIFVYASMGVDSEINGAASLDISQAKFYLAHPKCITKSYRIKNRFLKKGVKFTPQKHYHYKQVGYASYYGSREHGRLTASGKRFNRKAMTAAHRSLPLPCVVRVTNLENKKSLLLVVNDRGPFPGPKKLENRIIDVSEAAAKKLGFFGRQGIAKVKVEALPDASLMLKNKLTALQI